MGREMSSGISALRERDSIAGLDTCCGRGWGGHTDTSHGPSTPFLETQRCGSEELREVMDSSNRKGTV
jgi:hypothetical protein